MKTKSNIRRKSFIQFNTREAVTVLIFLGLMTFANAIYHPFVHDDLVFIRNNPNIADIKSIPSVFIQPNANENIGIINTYYRPLLELVYRIQYALFNFQPQYYHFFNIILHIFNSILIFAILKVITNLKGVSWCTALLFLIHPIQTESVACISGISNLLMTTLCLSSFWFYMEGQKSPGRSGIIAVVLYGCALLTKEQAIVLPAILLLYEYSFSLPAKRPQSKVEKLFRPLIGFITVTLGYLVWRKIILGGIVTGFWGNSGELILRLFAIPQTLLTYWGLLLLPHNLHYYRSINMLQDHGLAPVQLTLIIAIVIYFIRRAPADKRNILKFGFGWFIITILPMLNIVPLINEYSYLAAFEHFLYLPMVGFFLCIFIFGSMILQESFAQHKKSISIIVMTILTILSMEYTIYQNTFWKNEVVLFQRALQFEYQLGRLHFLLGRAYFHRSQLDMAIAEFNQALGIFNYYHRNVHGEKNQKAKNVYAKFITDTHQNLAMSYEAKGMYDKSVQQYKLAIQMDPQNEALHNNLGLTYILLGKKERAMDHFQSALKVNPKDVRAMSNLAICLIEQGQRSKAEELLRQALKLDQNFVPARKNLEKLLSGI